MSGLLGNIDKVGKKCIFALGCFWMPDSVYGAMRGVLRTRVGYCGGKAANPTYHNLHDYTESICVEYDPDVLSYGQLLDVFWNLHDPTSRASVQYQSAIYYSNEEQKEVALKSLEAQTSANKRIVTKVVPATTFYDAESYHQKYRLQQHSWLMKELGLKSNTEDLVRSQAAARLNGYVVGVGGTSQFEEELPLLKLSPQAADRVRRLLIKYQGQGLFC